MLEEDKVLLEEDFEKLGLSTATKREFWVASIEAAISAAEHKQHHNNSTIDNEDLEDHVLNDLAFDNVGSLRYQKRQQQRVTKVCQY